MFKTLFFTLNFTLFFTLILSLSFTLTRLQAVRPAPFHFTLFLFPGSIQPSRFRLRFPSYHCWELANFFMLSLLELMYNWLSLRRTNLFLLHIRNFKYFNSYLALQWVITHIWLNTDKISNFRTIHFSLTCYSKNILY